MIKIFEYWFNNKNININIKLQSYDDRFGFIVTSNRWIEQFKNGLTVEARKKVMIESGTQNIFIMLDCLGDTELEKSQVFPRYVRHDYLNNLLSMS